jgi:hypothetical protein
MLVDTNIVAVLSVIMLNVVMLTAVMLNVVTPFSNANTLVN